MPKTHFPRTGGNVWKDSFYHSQRETLGNEWYVDSGVDSTSGYSPEAAFGTLDEAVNAATASNGDIIYCAEGHTETKAATGALATMDVAGVRVVGMGHGNQRPTFVFDHTGANIPVSAADVSFENCIFKASTGDITRCFDVTAAGFTLKGCTFVDDAATDNFIDVIDLSSTSDNNADRLTVIGCEYFSDDTGNDAFIEVNADVDRMTFVGNRIHMGVADNEAIISMATGKDLTNVLIQNNVFYRLNTAGDLVVDSDTTANSGIVSYNVVGHADTQTEVLFDITGARLFENRGTAVDDTQGYLVPVVDS